MLHSPLPLTAGTLAAIACSLAAISASAAEAPQGPMQTYVPPPNYAPPPAYAPPPNYTPPPNYAPPPAAAPQPGYGQQPQGYGQQPPTYAPPPNYGGGRYNPSDVGRPGWSVAGLVGFGTATVYGFGIGVRGGYTLPQRIYVGGEFGYYFGGSNGGWGWSTYQLGPEVGYDISIAGAPVLIRPYVGLGYQGVDVSSFCVNNSSQGGGHTGGFTLWGGAIGTYSFTPNWFVGGDVRLFLPVFDGNPGGGQGMGYIALGILATGGYKF